MSKTLIKISNGPSREELFDGLRLFAEKRTVGFILEKEGKELKPSAWIHSIEAEDGSGNSWNLKFSIPEGFIKPANAFKKAGSVTVNAYYSTRTRQGSIVLE